MGNQTKQIKRGTPAWKSPIAPALLSNKFYEDYDNHVKDSINEVFKKYTTDSIQRIAAIQPQIRILMNNKRSN